MGRQQPAQQAARPKRKATNAHVFRYLQTRNPSRLEENDLKKALEASLEECPADFFWPAEDSASCSSSEQSTSTSSTSGGGGGGRPSTKSAGRPSQHRRTSNSGRPASRRSSLNSATNKSSMHLHHLNSNHHSHNNHQHNHHQQQHTANHKCCPMSCVHNRYKPVAKKNIYSEADFFHEGIMEYIEYALAQSSTYDHC